MPTASCQCGALTAEVEAWSPAVVACHCLACQRRTGSAFGVGVYYPADAVSVTGSPRSYARPTSTGGEFLTQFCGDCGSSVLWTTAKHPGLVGIAVGAFADSRVPPPVRSVWEATKHPWVEVGCAMEHFPGARL